MMDFSGFDLGIGDWVSRGVEWLTANWGGFFDAIAAGIGTLTSGLVSALQYPPALVLALALAVLGGLIRSWKFAAFMFVAFAVVGAMSMWDEAMSTFALVLVASLFAIVIGVPIGILAAKSDGFSALVRPVLDLMQTMPSFVYLIPAIVFFGIGEVPGVVATVVFSIPPAARLTELGLRQVDAEVIEAGEAFGASPRSILTKVQIPLALPTIMAGINQVIMLALSMVVIAGIVGAGGLGSVVFRGVARLDVGLGFEGGLSVVILAVFLDRITSALGTRASARTSR